MDLDRTIVIVGTGRCGSTLLHRLLGFHRELGWLSNWNEAFPARPWVARLSRLYGSRLVGRRLRQAYGFPRPYETYRFWNRHLPGPGFSRRDRPPRRSDVPRTAIPAIRRDVERVLRHQGRSRLLVKVTGWSRIDPFDELFPEAFFVWMQRDPRSVVSSWLQAGWLDVASSPESADWQWGEVRPEYLEIWRAMGGGEVLSAALKVHRDVEEIRRSIARFPGRSHRLRYEELVTEPEETLRGLLAACDVPWTEEFERRVDETSFYDRRARWKEHLTPDQGDAILEFVRRAGAVSAEGMEETSSTSSSQERTSAAGRGSSM